jgi:NAD(P)-dependent dehydrogenase (short-subunit alcohol dehydrogenase family)
VVISYCPTEEPDAHEVIELIKAEGGKAIPIPGDLREENYCKELVAKALAALGGLDIIVSNAGRQQQCEDRYSSTDHRSFRRNDEDQYLRPILDHQGCTSAHAAGLVHHSNNFRASVRSYG